MKKSFTLESFYHAVLMSLFSRELDFIMSVSTRAYTVWILSNDMMQQNNLTGKVGITLSLIDSSPIKAVLCFCFGQLMTGNHVYKINEKKKGNPIQPINTLGRSFYQWLLVGGWTVHEGDLHEYLNLF